MMKLSIWRFIYEFAVIKNEMKIRVIWKVSVKYEFFVKLSVSFFLIISNYVMRIYAGVGGVYGSFYLSFIIIFVNRR